MDYISVEEFNANLPPSMKPFTGNFYDNAPLMRCCLCRKKVKEYGNNPYPIVKLGKRKCCDSCNETKVIPARLGRPY